MAAETARAARPDISHRNAESAKVVVPQPVEGCEVVAAFDGGAITSDAGALLLGATDRAIGLMSRLAGCFHARAASGQAAAPPSVAMNSRRRKPMRIWPSCGYEAKK